MSRQPIGCTQRAAFLAEADGVMSLLICGERPDSRSVLLDAGMRPGRPAPGFEQVVIRTLTRTMPWSPDARIIRQAPDHAEVELPIWVRVLHRRVELNGIRTFPSAFWRGRAVRLGTWALDRPGGEEIGISFDNHGLPKQRELWAYNERMISPPSSLLRDIGAEWVEFTRPLAARGWHVQLGPEPCAAGAVPVAELELIPGPLPDEFARWLLE